MWSQIMALVMVDEKWASYAWDMKRRQLTIHAAGNTSGEWTTYDEVATLLNSALRTCIDTFFNWWKVDWSQWATVYTIGTAATTTTRDR
jgi:hypothetical protein